MLLKKHIAASVVVSTALYFTFHSMAAAVSSCLAGILIDLDHIPDYIYSFGWKGFCYKDFESVCRHGKNKKFFLVLHSYELLLIFLTISLFTKNAVWLGIFVGFTQHILLDQVSNSVYRFSYFFFFRLKGNFAKERMFAA